ncbi:MAG: cohesin domain-containing protein [Ruminococcus sp.]|nr:cohesin domain-containing protein [Ruminococcus sp.]
MKKFTVKILSFVIVITMLMFAMPSAFAAEELVINSNATVNVGDKFTFTLLMSDCEDPVIGLQMYLSYDQNKLKYVDDSLEFGKFEGVVYNPKREGYIPLSWTDISAPADFSSRAVLLKADFEVIEGGETDITDFIADMYGEDMTYMKNYTIRYTVSVNGDVVGEEKPAVVTTDESFISGRQGDFINYSDSQGNNSENADEHQPVTMVVEQVVNVTQAADNTTSANGNGSVTATLVIVAIIIIILAIVAVLIVKKRDDDINSANESNTEE